MPRQQSPTSRYWCFTFNNPEEYCVGEGIEPADLLTTEKCTYAIWQLEKGTTEHFQGYVILTRHRGLAYVKKIFNDQVHWEIAKGTIDDNQKYCSKEETRLAGPFECGEAPTKEPGKRNDLLDIKKKIDEGAKEETLWEDHFGTMVRNFKGVGRYGFIKGEKRSTKTEVIVMTGDSGIGKSWMAKQLAPDAFWCYSAKWWDGYDGKSDIIFDEFHGQLDWDVILRMMDEYPMSVELKGGTVNFNPKRIIFTSNTRVEDWYDLRRPGYNRQALFRRIDYLWEPVMNLGAPQNAYYFTEEWAKEQASFPAVDWDRPLTSNNNPVPEQATFNTGICTEIIPDEAELPRSISVRIGTPDHLEDAETQGELLEAAEAEPQDLFVLIDGFDYPKYQEMMHFLQEHRYFATFMDEEEAREEGSDYDPDAPKAELDHDIIELSSTEDEDGHPVEGWDSVGSDDENRPSDWKRRRIY